MEIIRNSSSSRTETQTISSTENAPQVLRLRLRSNRDSKETKSETKAEVAQTESKLGETKKPSVKWTEDTINNENLGRKSSKRKHSDRYFQNEQNFLV